MFATNRQQALASLLLEAMGEEPGSFAKVTQNCRFDELGLDSLDITEFLLRVESHFLCSFDGADRSKLLSLADIEDFMLSIGVAE